MKHKYYFLLPLLFISCFSYAQQLKVTGTISSLTDGFPLPGVLVEVKNNKHSTLSDAKGCYQIPVQDPENDVLVFTYMGFLIEEVAVKKLSLIDVSLSEDVERSTDTAVIPAPQASAKKKKEEVEKAQHPDGTESH